MSNDLHAHVRRAEIALNAFGLGGINREMAPLVLLAFLAMKPGDPWHHGSVPLMTITQAMLWMKNHYGVAYAPNTRESVRFSVVMPLVAAGVLVPNPDKPRAKQSPNYCYQLETNHAEIIRLIS